jgi:hypothetical protein
MGFPRVRNSAQATQTIIWGDPKNDLDDLENKLDDSAKQTRCFKK